MKCDDCIKSDVCGQKNYAKKLQDSISKVSIKIDSATYEMRILGSNYGIGAEVTCSKYVYKKSIYDEYDH